MSIFQYSFDELRQNTQQRKKYTDFLWKEYSYYENKRSELSSEIKNSLMDVAYSNSNESYFRIVEKSYSDNPLSMVGSQKQLGGRFNFGEIDPSRFPVFPCLYIAYDHKTAKAEKFSSSKERIGLSFRRENLSTTSASYTLFKVSYELEFIIDVMDKNSLKNFINIIGKIQPSSSLKKLGKSLGISDRKSIKNFDVFQTGIKDKNWRFTPRIYKVPSVSQTFGHIVKMAGIQGIFYKSQHTPKNCLAIFPENFNNHQKGHVKLMNEVPSGTITELNKDTWKRLV